MTATISPTSSKTTLALEARGLSCVRGERQLFSGLDLSVSAGQCLHIRGENGVGKTSLLRILTGLSKPESGEVLWGNQSIGLDSLAYHRELLFLGHRDALKEDLSAIENLKMYAELDDVALPLEKALATLWHFGLRGRENLPVHCLSAGQKRRLLMARMSTRQAKLWILDEPFNALDSKAVNALQDLIAEHLSDGGLVVLTSHQTVSLPSVRVLEL
ncbi:cytochrome c biogenesis heme-transporting ATPase CcmA [Polynucleobacter sp. MWH-Creno-3A4]|uniref:cytochrome c biogenesis heme-transporting ATPase CcmA n=1 Tax=Polynucleobacter sp. MWH-Creno-3A4 TaxID=1855886 RepID=UPI001C0E1B0F|nr:cytochrome c biogenesis heme-transporting ATPase CcmA [Polynucleobacter sp. MWH-Creno-3A4]MBU3605431.1 cytochrome c biogenesis heme-transporting ATPase CcmA [Polynucleobacter sp. MWH-Creno-3A4]